ncbi:MAG: hypothetical protein ACKODB_00335 [Betaproteobacteria bacterium]
MNLRSIFIGLSLDVLSLTGAEGVAREVIEASLQRSPGASSAVIRGLLDRAPQPNGKLLLVFPGWPGIPRIEVREGRPAWLYLQQHVEEMKPLLHEAGISLMTVDCPTDQWGVRGPNPTACDDNYRSSEQHASDVRSLLRRTEEVSGLRVFDVKGLSDGAVSSPWLALRLGDELAGSIHSATQSVPGGGAFTQYAYSVARTQPSQMPKSSIYLHHRDDLCRFTPYEFAKVRGVHGLMTVVGGNRSSEPCGKASFHSYSERTQEVGAALVRWINDGVVTPVIKGASD